MSLHNKMLRYLSRQILERYNIKDETMAFTKFNLNRESMLLLIDAYYKYWNQERIQDLSTFRCFFNLYQELHDFFVKNDGAFHVVGIEFPHIDEYIFPTDSYKYFYPFLDTYSITTVDDLYKKDAQLFEMSANSFQKVIEVIIHSHKLISEIKKICSSRDYFEVKIVLRKFYEYKSNRKFLLTIREKDWILRHKYMCDCVNMNEFRYHFKKIIQYLHIPKFHNKTLEIHVSNELLFSIIKCLPIRSE